MTIYAGDKNCSLPAKNAMCIMRPMKYRSIPVIISAKQITPGETLPDGVTKSAGADSYQCHDKLHPGNSIICFAGDYIITGTEGETYPCRPWVFHKKYEPVE